MKIDCKYYNWIFVFLLLLLVGGGVLFRFFGGESMFNHSLVGYTRTLKEPPLRSELDIVFGDSDAELTVFMYADYACRYCKRFFEEVFPELEKNDRVNIVVKLVGKSTHPAVQRAQRAAVCIYRYGNYLPLHNLFVFNYLSVYSSVFGVMLDEFISADDYVAQCMLEGESEEYLAANGKEFDSMGFTGTPVFVINNHVYTGFRSAKDFGKIVEFELSRNGKKR